MQKLFIDCRMLYNSGIGRYIQELVPVISKSFETRVILKEKDVDFAVQHNLQYTVSNTPIYSIKEQFDFIGKGSKDSIFWSPHYNVPFFPFKSRARVVTIHDVSHLALKDQFSLEKRLYAKLMIQRAISKSDKVITVSEFSKNEIVRYTGCRKDKIKVIYNGGKAEATITHTANIKAKYDLPENYLLYVGNVKPHKNLKRLLEAYLMLDSTIRSKYKIVIVGKREGFITGDKELVDWIDSTGELKANTHFTRYVTDEDLFAIYQMATVFVFPSIYEGFGIPPLEAMASDCPVICSNKGSLPEVCGNAAVYFNPFAPNDICKAIASVVEDNARLDNLVRKGKERLQMFNWDRCIQEHIHTLCELL